MMRAIPCARRAHVPRWTAAHDLTACPHVPGLPDVSPGPLYVSPGPTHVPCERRARFALSALDDEGLLTRLGRKMADFPMEPPAAKMLIASVDLGCSEEIMSIVSMLSVQNMFYRPKERHAQADSKKAKPGDPIFGPVVPHELHIYEKSRYWENEQARTVVVNIFCNKYSQLLFSIFHNFAPGAVCMNC